MYIKEFEITKLHGEYDYKVSFNRDITFIYGPNGCGKTTVLSLLSSIITNKFYKLLDYKFSKLNLIYGEGKKGKEYNLSVDIVNNEIDPYMVICSNGNSIIIDEISTLKERLIRNNDEDLDASFEELYPEILSLKNIFHYVYLPLSRLASTEMPLNSSSYFRYKKYYLNQNLSNTYLNDSLLSIEELVKKSCNQININEIQINNNFRKKVLSSATRVSKESPISQILSEIDNINMTEVLRTKDAYINTLKDLEILDKELNTKIEQFFEEFGNEYEKHQDDEEKVSISYAFLYNDFLRIKQVVEFAKENEKAKEKNRHNKDLFTEVINDFFKTSGTDKEMFVNKKGEIYFSTHNKNLELQDLSSGEKQIIITFASYIFGIEDSTEGIYIVDEPEASLHLQWQAKFVESLLKTNKKIQLIFATHSPELIGKYDDKEELLEGIRNV